MSPAESQYLALLRAALWEQPAALEGSVSWEEVMHIARHHTTDVIISGVASQLPDGQSPRPEMLAKMQAAMRGNLVRHLHLKQILVSVVTLLRNHGIEPVLLKGFSLAMLYPNPNLRQFGDIDVYIGPSDFRQACALLRTLPGGYNWGEEVEVGKHYNIEFGPYPLEIHRVSADVTGDKDNACYALMEREGLVEKARHVDFEGLEIVVPSKEFMAFFTFFHAWEHFLTSGVGWRQVCDVAMVLHTFHGQLDLAVLQRYLLSMHLMEPWQTFGWLMVNCLGLPKEEMPFYDGSRGRKAQKLYRRIMKEGNFKRHSSFKRRKPKNRVLKKLHSFVGIFVDFFYRAAIFPSAAFREMRKSLRLGFGKVAPH